ncbi:MAG: hypothetical protein HY290_16630 [Planctomycetia bacterium]|nr:hypothetical protein [Planctomycetia bacterium]
MQRLPRIHAAIAVASFSIAVTAHGATPKNSVKPDPGRDAVRNVLRAEVAGPIDRRAQLANAIEKTPDSAIAHWQAGYVRAGSDWRRFEDSARAALSGESLLAYRQQRARAQRTAADQLKLADWCRARNLPDQERAHLFAVLALGAGDAVEQIAGRLGYQQIGGRWLSREQLLEWNELNRRAEQSLKKWEPQLTKQAERLARSPAQREQAVAGLKKSVDLSAVAAIEYVLAGRDEETALVAVELLRPMEGFEASLALARQAVFSPWEAVRKSAGAALPGRPLDDFVPDLLGLLRTPIKSDL